MVFSEFLGVENKHLHWPCFPWDKAQIFLQSTSCLLTTLPLPSLSTLPPPSQGPTPQVHAFPPSAYRSYTCWPCCLARNAYFHSVRLFCEPLIIMENWPLPRVLPHHFLHKPDF